MKHETPGKARVVHIDSAHDVRELFLPGALIRDRDFSLGVTKCVIYAVAAVGPAPAVGTRLPRIRLLRTDRGSLSGQAVVLDIPALAGGFDKPLKCAFQVEDDGRPLQVAADSCAVLVYAVGTRPSGATSKLPPESV